MKTSFRYNLILTLCFVYTNVYLLSYDEKTKLIPHNNSLNVNNFCRKKNDREIGTIIYRQPVLTWRIVNVNFGWEKDVVDEYLWKTKDSQIQELINNLEISTQGAIKMYDEAELDLQVEVSPNHRVATTEKLDWRKQNQNRARNLKALMHCVDKQVTASGPYIEFSVLFINTGDQEYICENLQVPVMVGPRVVTYAQCYEIEASTSFYIPPDRPQGIPVRFRAHLDNTQALELLDDLQKASPLFKLENSRGSIIAMRTKEDVISQIQISNTKTCLLTIRRKGALPISWQIYRDTPSFPVTLQMAMEAVNAQIQALTVEPRPVFNLSSGLIKSVAGFDNTGPWWHLYIDGKSIPIDLNLKLTANVDFEQAVELPLFSPTYLKTVLKRAKSGDSFAQVLYGCCFYNGVNATQNYTKAAIWFRRAAAQEDAGAQNNLGQCYEKGRGIVKDKNEAAKWLIYSYHLLRELTLGVVYSEREAVQWYRRAANQGHAEAQYNLGRCYQEGIGVAEDAREAVKWYRMAADQGNALAQYELGWCYQDGKGVPKDEREAVKWYRRAANQGHAEAQYELGRCYQEGIGVAKDEREARKWFGMAIDQGYDPIRDWLPLVYGIFTFFLD